jgi:probable rRNA maturation factor
MNHAVAARRKAPTLSLSVQYASNDADLPGRPQIRRWVRAALLSDATVTVRFVDAIEGRAINAEFRGKDYATNVLTFVYDDEHPRAGDVVLCAPVVRREAAAQGKPLADHHAHLVVHGMLHLQGFDHERRADALVMEARETAILATLGLPDPYAARN